MSHDELGTLDLMSTCFDTLRVLTRRFDGELVKTIGDGALILFKEPSNAVRCSIEFHRIVDRLNTASDEPAAFRIGVHSGEVIRQDGDAFGHAVNIASRLEVASNPGTCTVSLQVYEQLAQDPEFAFEPLGKHELKNISEQVTLFRVMDERQSLYHEKSEPVRIRTIGALSISNSSNSTTSPMGRVPSAILGYLALTHGQSETHKRLATLLWPDREEKSAERSLKRSVRQLREFAAESADDIVQSDRVGVSLKTAQIETDLDTIERVIRASSVPELLSSEPSWSQMILVGLEGLSPLLDSWIQVIREKWRDRILRSLESLLQSSASDSTVISEAAQVILVSEPGNEMASLALMRHLAARENRAAAIAEYDRLCDYLADKFGIEPSASTQRAIDEIRVASGKSRAEFAATAPRRRISRIAISPFRSQDDHSATLEEIFRSELIGNLARFREWSVIDGLSHRTNRQRDDEGIADYRIDGAADDGAAGRRLLLTLHDNRVGRVLWRTEIAFDPRDWLDQQRLVIAKIASEVDTYVSADRLARTIGGQIVEINSHDQWLKGQQNFMRWTPDSAEDAIRIFKKLISQDPDFAPAFSSLAGINNVQHIIWPGRLRDMNGALVADQLASQAAKLDPMDSRIHRAVAWSAAMTGSFDRASLHLDLCLNLNSNSPADLASCAMGFSWFGEHDRAEALVTRLLAITPNLPGWIWCYLASVYFFSNRLEDALRAAELSGDSIIDNQGWMAAILARMGRKIEAGQAFCRLVDDVSPNWTGAEPISHESVWQWFVQAYPIRYDSDLKLLSEALASARRAASQVQKKP